MAFLPLFAGSTRVAAAARGSESREAKREEKKAEKNPTSAQCCQPGIFNAFYGKIGIF